ncbi:unnamed protein product [Rhizophagus irregularis]|nr:unnamed protein product [Rhizophagus irregularis]
MLFMNVIGTNERNFLMQDEMQIGPKKSETDEDNSNKYKIIIWDRKWRSSSLRTFLQNYVDSVASSKSRRDLPEEDDQVREDENQEVVDENQDVSTFSSFCTGHKSCPQEVEENQEEVDENQKDEEEDQNKNKRGVSVVSSEYDSISSE